MSTSASLGESSASIYSDLHPADGARIFHVYHSKSHFNLSISNPDKSPLFFVKNSSFTPRKPDVTFHIGTDQSGPTAAVCKFMKSSSLLKIGLGDPNDPNAMVWEEMTKQKWDHSNYRWEMTIHPPSGHPERRSFLWKRTHSVGVEESMPAKLSQRNFKLVDERTGELLAVYANNGAKSWKKAGKLQINKDYGRDWDTMVLLTGLSLLEKERRRSRNSSGGGGGGGGG